MGSGEEAVGQAAALVRGGARRDGVSRGRIFALFTCAYFLSYFLRSANAIIAGDLSRDMSLDAAQLGLMSSLFFGAFALAQLPLGAGLDRWGPRAVVPGLMAAAVVGCALFAGAPSFGPLALGRALIGMGMAAILPSSFKIFSLWYPAGRVATMSGLLVGIGSSGALVSATPLAWLTSVVGWRAVFAGVAVAIAISALAIVALARNTPPGVEWPAAAASGGGFRAVFADRRFWQIVPLGFFFTGGILAMQGLWAGPYLFDVLGLSRIEAGNVILLLAGGVTIGSAASGWCVDRFGVAQTIAGSAALFVVCQFALTVRPPLAVIVPLYFVYGLSGSFCIMCMAHARQIFPAAITGQAVTAVNFFSIGGSFCIQWWLGLIIKPFGADAAGHYPPEAYTAAFLFAAAGTLVALLWYLPLARETMRGRGDE
ncbi:MAG: MFS transporter [Thermomicrobiales bacterium]